MSWVEDQGSWNPLDSPGPYVSPVQITFVLALDWIRMHDPTGNTERTNLSKLLDYSERFRIIVRWLHLMPQLCIITKQKKRVYATTNPAMQQQTLLLRQLHYMRVKFCLVLLFVYFEIYFLFCIVCCWDLACLVSFIFLKTSRQRLKTCCSGLLRSIKEFTY